MLCCQSKRMSTKIAEVQRGGLALLAHVGGRSFDMLLFTLLDNIYKYINTIVAISFNHRFMSNLEFYYKLTLP